VLREVNFEQEVTAWFHVKTRESHDKTLRFRVALGTLAKRQKDMFLWYGDIVQILRERKL